MSFLKMVEEKLEIAYDNFIGKIFKGPIQPGEIANRAIRSMLRNKKKSINKNYVPNYYRIGLSKDDYMNIQPIANALSEEICELLTINAVERNLSILGTPVVDIEIEHNLTQGKLIIESKFKDIEKPVKTIIAEEKALEDTLTFGKKVIEQTLIKNEWSFQVLQGPDQGKKIKILAGTWTLGRKPENDIVLNDSSISRIHASIKLVNGKLTITDLDSTNGIFINEVRLKESQLFMGDKVLIGQTQLLVVKE